MQRWYKWLIFRCTEKSGESLNTNLLWDILRTKSFCFGITVLYPSSYCKQSNIAKLILQKYSWKNNKTKPLGLAIWLDQESPRESVWLTVSVGSTGSLTIFDRWGFSSLTSWKEPSATLRVGHRLPFGSQGWEPYL